MDETKQDYFSELLEFIATAQWVEEMLKFYLYRCEAITSKLLKDTLPFQTNMESISNSALGRLIEKYRRFSDNTDLIERLRKFKPKRDRIVHAGFVKLYRDKLDEQAISLELSELQEINTEADDLIQVLLEDAKKIESAMNQL